MEKNGESTNAQEIVLFGVKVPVGRQDNGGVPQEKREKRKYTKSAKPRIRWTTDMHTNFLRAIQQLGGPFVSETCPKHLIKLMGIEGLTLSQVKSHLQAYRNAIKHGKIHGLTCPEDNEKFKKSFSNNNLQSTERKRDSMLLAQQGPFLMIHSNETCSHLQASQYNRDTTTFYEFGNGLLEDGEKSEVITSASL